MMSRGASEVVSGFEFPDLYGRMLDAGLVELRPWVLFDREELVQKLDGLIERYPARRVVPFAGRLDTDDVACWERDDPQRSVVIIHDYASPGWESRNKYPDTAAWLRAALEDFIYFE